VSELPSEPNSVGFGDRYGYRKVLPVVITGNFLLVLDSFSINRKIAMSEETPNFNINPDAGMTPSGKFTYIGHQVEIVAPDTARLTGNYWQIKIDGVLQHNFLFNSARVAADQAEKFIERQQEFSVSDPSS
jgi:hypothetical protein